MASDNASVGISDAAIILRRLNAILVNQEKQMAAIDDLNTAIATLNTNVTALTTAVDSLIAKPDPAPVVTGTPDAEVEAAVAQVTTLNGEVTALTAKVDAALAAP